MTEPSGYVIVSRQLFEQLVQNQKIDSATFVIEWGEPYSDSVYLENIYDPVVMKINVWSNQIPVPYIENTRI